MSETPKLSNDCFVLPEGVSWTPVDEALKNLRGSARQVTQSETLGVLQAGGRILAENVTARRANPPYENSAMDGYGFANVETDGERVLPLVDGRSAAGAPYLETVPAGMAIRILTGAKIPAGVDTVVMQEDVALDGDRIRFGAGLKTGANIRPLGEDVTAGQDILPAGRVLLPQDLGLLAAAGVDTVRVCKPLRVAVLSTGDELRQVGEQAEPHQIYDSNRPMLLELVRRWGMEPVDLGHAGDAAEVVHVALDRAVETADVVLTTGGASAGDEDHISAALRKAGALNLWRVAIKPGRPLALGMWNGVPVFGLPGNPVAALTCALLFARPYLSVLAGGAWLTPRPLILPAAFSKNKKEGRREYLRARLNDAGSVEVYHSEGSGRISGLSWADGLVELEDGARQVSGGDPVRFYPYSAFGV